MILKLGCLIACLLWSVSLAADIASEPKPKPQPANTSDSRLPDSDGVRDGSKAKHVLSSDPGMKTILKGHEGAEREVRIKVVHGENNSECGDRCQGLAVFLRATRPKGPFQTSSPPPAQEWEALTGPNNEAVFSGVPQDLVAQGLRLQAVVIYGGVPFEGPLTVPTSGLRLTVPVYERSPTTDGVEISQLRTIVEPWEDYLVFSQFYTFSNPTNQVIDLTLGESSPDGIRIELPTKAKGIHADAAGKTKVINSTVFWAGKLVPNQTQVVQVRFSMACTSDSFVYRQSIGLPVREADIVVPLDTRFKKLPRLDDVELAAPGFAKLEAGWGIGGLRNDREFLIASSRSYKRGTAMEFKLSGLPFRRPLTPWLVLLSGILAALLVGYKSWRDAAAGPKSDEQVLEELKTDRNAWIRELLALEQLFSSGQLDEDQFLQEKSELRNKVAVALKNIKAMESEP
jgi:hypothetical protein